MELSPEHEKVIRLIPMSLDISFLRFDLPNDEAEKYEEQMAGKWDKGLAEKNLEEYGGQIYHFFDPKHWAEVTAEEHPKNYQTLAEQPEDILFTGDYYCDDVILRAISPESKQLLRELRSLVQDNYKFRSMRPNGPSDPLHTADLYDAEGENLLPSLPKMSKEEINHVPTEIMNWLGFEGDNW